MAKPTSNTDNTVEALLQQRAQYEQWLARLDSAAGEKAPASVRERVRGDYEARLRGVIDELRSHSATIAEELEQHRETQRRVDGERRTAEETLAEAEVRYAVGEYADEEWQRLSQESQQHLDGLREELRVVNGEIDRLAEVQALIGAPARQLEPAEAAVVPAEPAAPAPEPAEPPPQSLPEPEPEPVAEPVSEAPAPARAAPPPPSPSRQPEPIAAAAAVDELAFLKSVSDDDPKAAGATRRPSNPGMAAPAAAPAKAPEPAAAPTATGRPSGVAKTLKCNECGTLNRPTEWYCERCGAELAAL